MTAGSTHELVCEGVALATRARFAEAVRCFHTALEQDPNNTRALFCLGAAHYHLGDMEQAVLCWERVAGIDPNYGEVEKWLDVATQRAAEHDGVAHSDAPPLDAEPATRTMRPGWQGLVARLLPLAILIVALMYKWNQPQRLVRVDDGLLYFLGAGIILGTLYTYVCLTWWFPRGSMRWSHRAQLACLAYVAAFALSVALLTHVNCAFDPNVATVKRVICEEVGFAQNRRAGTTYYAVYRSWRGEEERLELTEAEYDYVQPLETAILFEVKPGLLGLEWIVGYELE